MKKEIKKKVLILSLVLLSLILVNFVLVAAEDAPATINPSPSTTTYKPSPDTFFGRWFNKAFSEFDAKMILWLMMFVVLLILLQSLELNMGYSLLISIPFSFVLVAYVTPDSIIGIFRSYQTIPLVFATFLPLAILFGITYLSIVRASRTLMTTQWLLWLIYLFFSFIKGLIVLLVYWDAMPEAYNTISEYMSIPLAGTEQFTWFVLATIVQVGVAGTMVIGSGKFMNWAITKTTGIEDAAAMANMVRATNAVKHLAKMEKDLGK